jgi:Rieske Fe-S protein
MSIEAGPAAGAEGASANSLAGGVSGDSTCLSRRAVLRAAAIAGAGMPLLAACGSSSAGASTPATSKTGGRSSTPTHSDTSASDASGKSGESPPLATTSQVPKGGGVILANAGVVITQPSPGTFKGFSSTCTHAGCPLDNVTNGTINCVCHGSQFSIKNGSVVTGPATVPLPAKPLVVKGKDISLK